MNENTNHVYGRCPAMKTLLHELIMLYASYSASLTTDGKLKFLRNIIAADKFDRNFHKNYGDAYRGSHFGEFEMAEGALLSV